MTARCFSPYLSSRWEPEPSTNCISARRVRPLSLLRSSFLLAAVVALAAVFAGSTPPATPDGSDTAQTALIGATYNGGPNSEVSADTPLKSPPDGGAYDAPDGGVLGSVILQVVGNESGQPSLFMNLDDNDPNPPGSSTVIFTGTGTT